jgi:hypothetical protein
MGIRIHKTLGWVLLNEDIDFDMLSSTTLNDLKNENLNDVELIKLDLVFPNINLSLTLEKFIHNASYDSNPNDKCYIFSVPYLNDWHRYNSTLDYYDVDSAERNIREIHSDIFPFYQKFVVSNTLIELEHDLRNKINLLSGVADYQNSFDSTFIKQLTELGFKLDKPLKEQIHMTCPRILQLILKKANPNINYKKLKPAIVTYWS